MVKLTMFILRLIRKAIGLILVFVLGIIAGGFAVTKVQPRAFIDVPNCTVDCLKPNEVLGLLGSIGVQYAPGLIPGVILETDKTVVINNPTKTEPIHFVIIPKKDIKNIAEMSPGDEAYLQDAVAVIGRLVREQNLKSFKVVTNGPGYQTVAYLHFHLTGK
jgi:histidine triad (HIT) family protein